MKISVALELSPSLFVVIVSSNQSNQCFDGTFNNFMAEISLATLMVAILGLPSQLFVHTYIHIRTNNVYMYVRVRNFGRCVWLICWLVVSGRFGCRFVMQMLCRFMRS